jgi:hypothetical protein
MEPKDFEKSPDVRQKNPVLEYLREKHRTLKDDYRTADGKNEICGLVASDVAEILLKEGKNPSIIMVEGKLLQDSFVNTEPLRPVQYKGRVSWGGHVVCICEGLVYDPMMGRPLPIESYGYEAFGTDVRMKTLISEDKIEDFIKNSGG